jgi:hypothetical protein
MRRENWTDLQRHLHSPSKSYEGYPHLITTNAAGDCFIQCGTGNDSSNCSSIALNVSGSEMTVEEPELEAGMAHDSDGVDMENSSMSETEQVIEPNGMSRSQAFNLYTSHLLSTWNIRQYEFAAVGAGSGD